MGGLGDLGAPHFHSFLEPQEAVRLQNGRTWPLAFVSTSVHLLGRHLSDCELVARHDLSVYWGPHRGFHSERAGHVPACAALHREAGGQYADGDKDACCVGGGTQGVEGIMARGGAPSPGGGVCWTTAW